MAEYYLSSNVASEQLTRSNVDLRGFADRGHLTLTMEMGM